MNGDLEETVDVAGQSWPGGYAAQKRAGMRRVLPSQAFRGGKLDNDASRTQVDRGQSATSTFSDAVLLIQSGRRR